jgi:glycosyltransferase involved in cell wall biosynthesis
MEWAPEGPGAVRGETFRGYHVTRDASTDRSGRAMRATVAMATFNGARYLEPQLLSILSQLGPADEVVIVDDASTDNTRGVIAKIADPRVRVIAQTTNAGVRASFERAMRAVRGEYLFLADQDDVWLPGKRDALAAALQAGAILALSDASVIDGEGREIESSFQARRGGFRGSVAATLVKNRYLGCSMAFRRELLEDILPIPAEVPMHDMWIGALAALRGRVAYIDRPLMQYRRHGANVSPEQRASIGQMLAWRWRLLSLLVARRVRGPRPVTWEPSS